MEGTAVYTQSGEIVIKSNQAITASEENESAVKVTDGGTYTLTDSTLTTSGNTSSMDSSSFYGLNAAALAESKSKLTLKNCVINTTGTGANGAFAAGEGALVELTDVKINCTASGTHGVDATLAGTLNLVNVDINTAGNGASAAIATDRGGGTINVTGGTVTTSGSMSPGIYSTGTITVNGGKYTSTGSEAAVIEGKNTISLTDTIISGAKNWGVMIYQSFSGDADVGTGNFIMNGGSLTALEGPLFYSTNTKAVIKLKGVELNAPSGTILSAGASRWGTTGKNGADVTLTADSQALNGNITCDSISAIKVTLQNGTALKGSVNADNKAGSMMLTLDSTSSWDVTGTSYLTGLIDADTTLANIHDDGNTIYYNSSSSANNWLNGKTYTLSDGGKLAPM